MKKFHSGYFLSIFDCKTIEDLNNKFIKEQKLKLISSNYYCNNWHIEWAYNEFWNGIEFIINAKSFEVAQNVLFNVHCASSVIEGKLTPIDDVHFAHEFGQIKNQTESINFFQNLKGFNSPNIPLYFYLSSLTDGNIHVINAIVKYHLSVEIYSQDSVDLYKFINWKKTDFNYIQIKFAYAIITAYSIIEELGLEIRATREKPSRLPNGNWNPIVKDELIKRIESEGVNVFEDIPWMIRGDATLIEERKTIKVNKLAEWSDSHGYKNEIFISINDGYVNLIDAIDFISFLRSKISSHRVGERIMELSVFDVANAQHLARRLILEKVGLWKNLNFY